MPNANEALLSRCKLGSHQTISIGAATAFCSTELAPGMYALYAKGCDCYVQGVTTDEKATVTVGSSCFYLEAGMITYFHVEQPDGGTSKHTWIGCITASAGVTGTLHINRVDEDK